MLLTALRALPEPCTPDHWCGDAFHFAAVWNGAGTAVAVGEGGVIARRIDGHWRSERGVTTSNLRAVAGSADDDVWASGDAGTLLHFDGRAWAVVPTRTHESLGAVAAATRRAAGR